MSWATGLYYCYRILTISTSYGSEIIHFLPTFRWLCFCQQDFLTIMLKTLGTLKQWVSNTNKRLQPWVNKYIRNEMHGICTRFDSFNRYISQRLVGIQAPDLSSVHKELDALWAIIEDMAMRLFPTHPIIEEIPIKDVRKYLGHEGWRKIYWWGRYRENKEEKREREGARCMGNKMLDFLGLFYWGLQDGAGAGSSHMGEMIVAATIYMSKNVVLHPES